MIALSPAGPSSSRTWTWPLDPSQYDQTPLLSEAEELALAARVQRSDAGQACSSVHMPPVLSRLTQPLYDVLDLTGALPQVRREVVHLLLLEMYFRRQTLWGWTAEDWVDLFNVERPQRLAHRLSHYRHQVYVMGYVLCNFTDFAETGRNVMRYPIAVKVFGQALLEAEIERVRTVLLAWGYSKKRSDKYLTRILCALFLANRSPYLEDLTTATLTVTARKDSSHYADDYVAISRVLAHLGSVEQPIAPEHCLQAKQALPQHVSPTWAKWCQKWHATSTLAATTRQSVYSRLLNVGRWLVQEHPEVERPDQWTRELTIEYLAAVDRLKVGDWADRPLPSHLLHKPLKPKAKVHLFSAMRMFFRDCQEWGWSPRRFDPARCFATPRSIKGLVGPDPRIIADDIWAKIWSKTTRVV